MQTFLTSINFRYAAKDLDNKRLNKQILEVYQILNVLSGQSMGWRNHPAVLMWKDAEMHLWDYIQQMIIEAKKRGIKTDKNESNLNTLRYSFGQDWGKDVPEFLKDGPVSKRLTATHKANLFNKDPLQYIRFQHYALHSPYNEPCCDTCKYYWPTHIDRVKTS